MSEKKGWSSKQVTVVIIVAALAGYVLGRLSTNLNLRFGGDGTEGPTATADFVLDDPGPLAADPDVLPVAHAPFLGRGAAPVTIVEFSDFQCPFCERATPVVHALMERYGDDLRVLFVNLPLPMHPEAEPAARAALAAQRQGAFWPYHDRLFENRATLGASLYETLAEELDLDLDQFRADFASEAIAARVVQDSSLARSLGINGTPTFLVNGVEIQGAQPPDAFAAIIDRELEAAAELREQGVPLTEIFSRRIEANRVRPSRNTAGGGSGGEESTAPERPVAPPVPVEPGPPVVPDGLARLTVYADFSSTSYRRLGHTLEQLMLDYGSHVQVEFQSYVDPENEAAVLASAALRAAESQGSFREYHRLLLENAAPITRALLEEWASQVELDMTAFRAALDDGEHAAFETAQREAARAQGVLVSPTVRVGDSRLVGPVPYEDLRVAVNASMEPE